MLRELLQYGQREGLRSEPGFKPRTAKWLLVFDRDGHFSACVDLSGGERKSKGREFAVCPELSQPELISAGTRHFLMDSLDKVVLLTKSDPTDKDRLDHSRFVEMLRKGAEAVPILATLVETLEDEEILGTIRKSLVEARAKPNDGATLAVMETTGPQVLVESEMWHPWWRSFRQSIAETKKAKGGKKSTSQPMRCFLSGELVAPTPTLNKITGLSDVGGLPTGDTISSFDKDAFCHYGFVQGQNAAMGEEAVKAFTDSLNHLIKDDRHCRRLASTKVVYWFSKELSPGEELVNDLFGDALPAWHEMAPIEPEPVSQRTVRQYESKAGELLSAIHRGDRPDLADCEFYAMTLSGNSGRVIVRDWMQGSFTDLAASVKDWFDDLTIVSRDGRHKITQQKFLAVLGAGVRDLRDVPSSTVAALWRCALQGRQAQIPRSLVAQTLARVRIDMIQNEPARHARLGLLRAFCIRNLNLGVPIMADDSEELMNCPPYICGGIMAILASIQREALGDVGAGVVQRYYAAASATPALVLGRLVRTAQIAHLPKIDGGLRHFFEDQLAILWGRLKSAPPSTLTLEEQTLFALGFYQQRARRTKKREDRETTTTEAS